MAFESLTDKLQNVFKKLKGKGRLTEADVKVALKEVKMALLEADVNFKVVKQFTKSVQEKAIGQDNGELVLDELRTCSWDDFKEFCTAVDSYIAKPSAETVILNDKPNASFILST